jgi:uncharacterized SAM-binding protein YcdF (DUF218 family)
VSDFIVSLTYPPYLTLLLLALGALGWMMGKHRASLAIAAVGIAWSMFWSIPACSDWLRGSLERQNPRVDEGRLPRGDAIVVLGGGMHYSWLRRRDVTADDLRSSRLAAGARAWQAGRAPLVILSGGGGGRHGTEAAMMARAIGQLGVPMSSLLLEEKSRSTQDNAVNTARLSRERGIHRVLLVTSAVHMPRARLLFQRAGVEVVPVPVPEIAHRDGWRDTWLPARGALWRSGRALKEYAGLAAIAVGPDTPGGLDRANSGPSNASRF